MKHSITRIAATAATLFASAASAAWTGDYSVDASHTNVDFTIRHMVSKVNGSFKEFEGGFSFDEKTKELSGVKFTIQTKSIDTKNEKRDEHLRGPDFFDAAKNPTLTFTGGKAIKFGKGKAKLAGDLTLHGVTKPTTFEVEYMGSDKDPWGNMRMGFAATTKIKRKDFGIVWNKTLDSGSLLLGDDVTINIQIEATPAKKEEKK